jgi:uncharacterized protein DUF302
VRHSYGNGAVFGAVPLASSALNACRRAASALAVTATSRLLAALGPVACEMVGERYGLKQYRGRTPSTPREYPLGDRRCPTPPRTARSTVLSPRSVHGRSLTHRGAADASAGRAKYRAVRGDRPQRRAERAGLQLRDTKLVIFGNPAAGTPVMVDAPLAALDLPLKVLV